MHTRAAQQWRAGVPPDVSVYGRGLVKPAWIQGSDCCALWMKTVVSARRLSLPSAAGTGSLRQGLVKLPRWQGCRCACVQMRPGPEWRIRAGQSSRRLVAACSCRGLPPKSALLACQDPRGSALH